MKFLVVILVVLAVVWLFHSKTGRGHAAAVPPAEPGQEEMLACGHCGLHFPRSEALAGAGGVFCSEAHRRAHFQRDTPP